MGRGRGAGRLRAHAPDRIRGRGWVGRAGAGRAVWARRFRAGGARRRREQGGGARRARRGRGGRGPFRPVSSRAWVARPWSSSTRSTESARRWPSGSSSTGRRTADSARWTSCRTWTESARSGWRRCGRRCSPEVRESGGQRGRSRARRPSGSGSADVRFRRQRRAQRFARLHAGSGGETWPGLGARPGGDTRPRLDRLSRVDGGGAVLELVGERRQLAGLQDVVRRDARSAVALGGSRRDGLGGGPHLLLAESETSQNDMLAVETSRDVDVRVVHFPLRPYRQPLVIL